MSSEELGIYASDPESLGPESMLHASPSVEFGVHIVLSFLK